eukprot:4201920-Pleurochrysis_carterae.AAC.2
MVKLCARCEQFACRTNSQKIPIGDNDKVLNSWGRAQNCSSSQLGSALAHASDAAFTHLHERAL